MERKSMKDNMAAYELMLKTNHHLIRGGEYSEAEKSAIANQLHANRITDGRKKTFNNPNWYPKFYIPPHNNGKRLQTVIPMSPKTYIVADNAYEFEILRLLHLFQPNAETSQMIEQTLKRLKKTCFGYESCHYAECFEAGMTVLRFLSFAAPHDHEWIKKQIAIYNNHFGDNRRHSGVQKYYWFILSEMPFELAAPEILKQEEIIVDQLNRSYKIKNENDDLLLYVMRNTLACLSKYSYLKDRKPYVDKRDGRLHFNLDKHQKMQLELPL